MTGTAFGRALAARRQARGLSQSRLAERAGCDHSFVSRTERGQRLVSREMAERFIEVLDCADEEANALLVAAGFAPRSVAGLMASAELAELDALHRAADEVTRAWLDDGVRLLLAGARARRGSARVVTINGMERETA